MSSSSKKKKFNKVQNEALPKRPSLQVLKESDEEIENFDVTRTDYQLNIDAIAGLAFIENIKSGQSDDQWNKKGWKDKNKSQTKNNNKKEEAEKTPHLKLVTEEEILDQGKFNFKTIIYLLIITGSLYGSYLLLNSTKTNDITLEEEQTTKKIVTKTPKRIHKSPKNKYARRNNRKKSIRRAPAATSFRESQVFKKHKIRKLEDNPMNEDRDDYNDDYDDGLDPIENDPIRDTASKEIINPEEDYFDEDEKDLYDDEDERGPSSEDEQTWVDAAESNNDTEENDDYSQDESDEEDSDFEDAEQF